MKKFSLVTYNLLNLNEPSLPMYRDKKGWSKEQYDRKVAWTARQIAMFNSDVFAFQELWHSESLSNAFGASGLKDDFELLTPKNTVGKKIVCAAAVRKTIAIESAIWIDKFPEGFVLQSKGGDPQTPQIKVEIKGFSRPVLHAKIRLHPDEELVNLFVCHFKSKGPTEIHEEPWYDKAVHGIHQVGLGAAISTIRRTAEAAAMRFILSQLMKSSNAPVIVMGDINDGQSSNTQNILTEQPSYLFGNAIGGGDTALYSAQIMQEFRDTRDVLYTYSYKGMKESLDHILFSQEFYDQSKKRIWAFDSLVVNNDHLNFDDYKVSGTNDHGIVGATFKYQPAS